jgi:uncharacterized protein (TIGR00290 family)
MTDSTSSLVLDPTDLAAQSDAEPVILSWSGGKDSALTLAALRSDPSVRVVGLLTTVTRREERISVHGVRGELLRAQASSVRLPLYEAQLPSTPRNGEYEAALAAALDRARAEHPKLRRVAFGDLFLEDIRRYREERLQAMELQAFFPVWERDTARLAHDFIDRGFRARLVCVDTQQLDASFVGRPYDAELLADLPATVDPCGENGEFHTFVSDGPEFTSPVRYEVGETFVRDGRFAHVDLLERD